MWCHCVCCFLVLQVQALLAGQPLLLQLAGLDHMSDDPTDMHVLYLKVRDVCPVVWAALLW
jgi:hypothetical protein